MANLGIPQNCIAFTNVTMESEKYICVREKGDQNNVVIIDMDQPNQPSRRQISADSAVMNPSSKVLALKAQNQRGGDSLQVFSLDTKSKINSFQMEEKVEFWRWIDSSTMGLVTSGSVYHWSMDNGAEPKKVFDRSQNLQGNQIINYRVTSDGKWMVVIGLAPPAQGSSIVRGNMQLFSAEQNRSQSLEAHAAAFSTVEIEGRDTHAQVIAFCSKYINQQSGQPESRVHMIELGAQQGKPGFQKKQHDLFFPQDHENDFPVSLQISHRFSLVYIITKMGLLFVFDLYTGTPIYRNRISQDSVFLTTENANTGGFYAINRKGSVLEVNVSEQAFVPFVAKTLQNIDLALSIARRGNLPGAEDLLKPKFDSVFETGDYKQAAELAASSPKGALRTKETISRFQMVPTPSGQNPPLLQYFGACLQKGKLYSFEAVELAKLVLSQGKKHLLDNWIRDDKLEASEELGDLMSQQAGDDDLALTIYERAGISNKVVSGYAVKGEFDKMTQYCQKVWRPYLSLFHFVLSLPPSLVLTCGEVPPIFRWDINLITSTCCKLRS